MRPRTRALGAAAAAVLLAGGAWAGWHAIPYLPPAHQAARPASVARQTAYLRTWWDRRNPAYGSYAGTDCVNFTSQSLVARGWAMSGEWGASSVLGRHPSTRTWVSSTAMMRWLAARPDLATPVDDAHRRDLAVGDVAQFDWDGSGDRDHTAVVSRIRHRADGGIEVDVAEHSPSGLHDSVDALLAARGPRAVVHYWHLRS